ncbi:MAG: sialate O-acetylesterase [Fidelibacterota bacterium]
MKRRIFSCVMLLLVSGQTLPALDLPAVFGDNMVLQQKSKVAVWGWASPNEKVRVCGNWSRRRASAIADESGKWLVRLKTPKAGGPYTLTVSADTTIVFRDVLIGEVWFCAGQSNMDMWMAKGAGKAGVLNYQEEIAKADYPNIRMFKVTQKLSESPMENCVGAWQRCTPESVARFSAVAYYYGLELYQELGVPIGLVQSSWGGSPAQAWTSREALESHPDFRYYLNELEEIVQNEKNKEHLKREYEEDLNRWILESYALDKKIWRSWISPELDDSDWQKMNLPSSWESAGLPDFDGTVWFRKHFTVPNEFLGKELLFDLGPVDDIDRTFINGRRIGEIQERGNYKVSREYPIPTDLLKPGDNVVSIRVTDYKGSGGIYGGSDHLRIVTANNQKVVTDLSGEWLYKVAYDIKDHRPIPEIPGKMTKTTPTALFNGMVAPLIPYTIKGVIWYQGESNRSEAYVYRELFPLMVSDWRERWQLGDFPFYYVQIAPFGYKSEHPIAAEVRESQLVCLNTIPNSGMVVTMDVGDIDDIHPRDKKTVGQRLSLWALAKTYHRKGVPCSGPLYREMVVEDNKVRIYFDFADDGLKINGDDLSHFSIAGADSVFQPAKTKIEGNTILVWNENITKPIAVRFGWSNTAELNLYNSAGLPASPFRTDDFPVSTQRK